MPAQVTQEDTISERDERANCLNEHEDGKIMLTEDGNSNLKEKSMNFQKSSKYIVPNHRKCSSCFYFIVFKINI